MKPTRRIAATLSLLALASAAHAVVVTFDGGIATRYSAPLAVVTDNVTTYDNVDYYIEDGFKLDFIGNTGAGDAFATQIGNYYGAGNAVIHGHWAAGDFGDLTQIQITKVGGGTFDLNYFILTSNTEFGGGPASGLEKAWVSHDGLGLAGAILLPPENWGFPGTAIFLPGTFDAVASVEFFVTYPVDCFGMDEFFIDEPAPPRLPDSASTLPLVGLALAALAGCRRLRVRA